MGVTAMDLPPEVQDASGSSRKYAKPPIMRSVRPDLESLKQTYPLYHGSGGGIEGVICPSPSGSGTWILVIPPTNDLANAVDEICEAFGLTKDELATICGVQSRKTLYNWINGETAPRKEAASRIFELLITARDWHSSGFVADQKQLHEPVVDNQSIYDLLKQPVINRDLIIFAGSRLNLKFPVKKNLPDPFA